MNPADPTQAPAAVPDPTAADVAMPNDGEDAVVTVTHEVDTDDMFDPMAG